MADDEAVCEHCDGRGWVSVDGYPEENERDFCPECRGVESTP